MRHSGTSGQDGGVSRHTVPPHTTKRRTTTKLKTKNNQNCQKIQLYGSWITKEVKKKHSSRPLGGAEMDSWAESTLSKEAVGGPGGPTFPQINWEEQLGSKNRPCNPGFQCREIQPQSLWLKTPVGVEAALGESQRHRRVCWRDPQCPKTHKPTYLGIGTRTAQFACG